MKKVFVIQAKDEFELVKKLNEEQNKKQVFASQTHQKKDGSFIAFVFFEGGASQKMSFQPPKKSNSGKSFIPTEKQLAQWANQPITEGQKKAIRKTGIKEEELNQKPLARHHLGNVLLLQLLL
jgi:hypothetical protein